MARIRSVHPSMFTDEAVVSCSPLARYLYVGLWTDADDQGLFEWKPLQIRMRLLPGDNAEVPELLAELVKADLIAPLESDGKKLGAIRYFRRFQRPKKPNSVFVLPAEWRTYVGLSHDGSPLGHDEGDEVPQKGEKSPQMEDGGGRGGCRVVEVATATSLSTGASPRRERAKSKASIPEGYPDAAALDLGKSQAQAAGVTLDVPGTAERFRNHALSEGRTSADWGAAWANWVGIEVGKAPNAARVTAPADLPDFPGPPDLKARAVALKGDAWTRSWLDPCGWRDLPEPAVIARNEEAARRLLEHVGGVLADFSASVIIERPAAA